MSTRNIVPRVSGEGEIGVMGKVWKALRAKIIEATNQMKAPIIEATNQMKAPTIEATNQMKAKGKDVATEDFVLAVKKQIQQEYYTGAVNKKTLTSVGYVTPHKAVVTAEIIGLTQDNLRRVKFSVIGACTEKGANGAEFRWLNFCTGNFGISSAYTDIYPQSEFVRAEDDLVPMIYCGCLPESKRGYGFMVNISKEQLQIGRIYTTNLDYGSYANSELDVGGFSFSFTGCFTNK